MATPVAGFNANPQNINKNGAPKKDWTWKSLIEEAAEEDLELKNQLGAITFKGKMKRAVIKKLFSLALKGEVQAIRELMNRTDGMPQQDITSAGEKIEMPILYIPEEKK